MYNISRYTGKTGQVKIIHLEQIMVDILVLDAAFFCILW